MIGERLTLFLMGFYLGEREILTATVILFLTIIIHYVEYEFEYKRTEYYFHEHGMKDE